MNVSRLEMDSVMISHSVYLELTVPTVETEVLRHLGQLIFPRVSPRFYLSMNQSIHPGLGDRQQGDQHRLTCRWMIQSYHRQRQDRQAVANPRLGQDLVADAGDQGKVGE